jgi:ferredoxin
MVITVDHFERLIAELQADGFTTVGPRQRDGAILLEPFDAPRDLAWGWRDKQEAGHYRLKASTEDTLEGFTVGPDAWKRFLYPPRLELLSAQMKDGVLELPERRESPPRYAFIGVRPCDLAAVAILDRVLGTPPFTDAEYIARRNAAFVVAMNCVRAGGTCFCTSQGTGPRARAGFDIALTELDRGDGPRYLAEAGSPQGRALLDRLQPPPATPRDVALADRRTRDAASQMGRFLQNEKLPEILYASLDSPIWDEIATRCFNCKNCTLVCPTCFCVSVTEQTSLDGGSATRTRLWDTCHSRSFTYIHGGPTRPSPAARYRQWLTHKFAGWVEQFGTSGCVGCGRCIAWCPAAIDVTAEAARLRTAAPGGVTR